MTPRTPALDRLPGEGAWRWCALGDGDGRPRCLPRAAAPPKLLIVDLIAQHDIQADEELAREGDLGLGPPAAMQDSEVTAPELVVGARGLGGRLAQHPAEKRVALLGDFAEMLLVGRGIDRRRQATNVADSCDQRSASPGAHCHTGDATW